ncbi:MAG: protein-L-isoaspartate(D-aspartate) O-methyltransferase [Candidatus Kapaibacteriota bacterium]
MDNLQIQKQDLINLLIRKGIKSESVLFAINKIPRELFISEDLKPRAYEDNALPILCGQTISQPYTVAFMTEILDLKPNLKVLEIGTGSGYQTCILKELAKEVYTIERIPELFDFSKNMFNKLGYEIYQKLGDGTNGWPEFAPYDRIIVTAGAPETPLPLLKQLSIGGIMVIPIGDKNSQIMTKITRQSMINFTKEEFSQFRFVPLIGKEGWQE